MAVAFISSTLADGDAVGERDRRQSDRRRSAASRHAERGRREEYVCLHVFDRTVVPPVSQRVADRLQAEAFATVPLALYSTVVRRNVKMASRRSSYHKVLPSFHIS